MYLTQISAVNTALRTFEQPQPLVVSRAESCRDPLGTEKHLRKALHPISACLSRIESILLAMVYEIRADSDQNCHDQSHLEAEKSTGSDRDSLLVGVKKSVGDIIRSSATKKNAPNGVIDQISLQRCDKTIIDVCELLSKDLKGTLVHYQDPTKYQLLLLIECYKYSKLANPLREGLARYSTRLEVRHALAKLILMVQLPINRMPREKVVWCLDQIRMASVSGQETRFLESSSQGEFSLALLNGCFVIMDDAASTVVAEADLSDFGFFLRQVKLKTCIHIPSTNRRKSVLKVAQDEALKAPASLSVCVPTASSNFLNQDTIGAVMVDEADVSNIEDFSSNDLIWLRIDRHEDIEPGRTVFYMENNSSRSLGVVDYVRSEITGSVIVAIQPYFVNVEMRDLRGCDRTWPASKMHTGTFDVWHNGESEMYVIDLHCKEAAHDDSALPIFVTDTRTMRGYEFKIAANLTSECALFCYEAI